MLRVLSNIICALRRWQIELRRCRPENIDIAFDGDEEEAEFVRHLAPQVAKWTLVGHGVVFFMSSMTFIWNVASIHLDGSWHQFGSNAYQYNCRYTLLMLTCFGAHGLVLAALITAYYARVSAARWEFISVLTTSLFVSMLPWLDPWHGVALVGGDPEVVWGLGAEEYEALRVLCLVAGVHAYALCVPIRWRYCFIVPLCCSISIIVSVCTVDSPFKASIPFKLPLMILLLLSPAVGQRSHEVLVREKWFASQHVSEKSDELLGMQAMSGVLCDVTFKLSSAFRFVGSDSLRDAFFGSPVEDTSILDLMSETDKDRFISSIDRMSPTRVPTSIPLTLKRNSGNAEVTLFVVWAHTGAIEEDQTFLVSLMVSKEGPTLEVTRQDSEDTRVSLPGSTLSTLPPLPEFDPIFPTHDDVETISDLSFTYSADSTQAVALNDISEADEKPQMHETRVSNAQSSKDPVSIDCAQMSERVDSCEVAVNTAWVWHNETFMCSSCAKPPKLPGPLLKASRRSGKHRKQQQQKQYEGTSFDGAWVLRERDAIDVPDWLRYFDIEGSQVVLGDLTTATIIVGDSPGEFRLCSARIWLDDNATLVCMGNSGRTLRYDCDVLSDNEDA
eukprot:TRINITY_DN10303_c0_g1_i8.p1 TRINITY_DN10303_c0_g1~~TRINITY_DN10303_c0_g1_i8.p1  ORF type:complete len:615 (+),score=64.88 TRINITY_DN10303_c0_g1_i8:156-2000(+)